jgi:hypothetical protein
LGTWQLTQWQNAQSGPTSTDNFLYDGEGNRVALKLDGTITYYLGQYSEVTSSTHTKYLQPGNVLPTVMSTGSGFGRALKFLMTDSLGRVTAVFDADGHAPSQTLYAPYGGLRYLSGGSGYTSKGFTRQRADA